MVKSILAAICVISATLAGLYGPSFLTQENSGNREAVHGKPEPFESDHIAVAVFRDGKVIGYFTSRLKCDVMDPSFKDSVLARLTHELYKAVYANAQLDFRKMQPEQAASLAGQIAQQLNDRAGKAVIENLTIEEPDFLRRL
jgi:hypothetical protein